MTTYRLLFILALIAIVGFAAYGLSPPDPTRASARSSRVAVEVGRVTRASIADIREFSGNLEASARLTVAPKVAGQVDAVAVDIGDSVKPGDILITLDDDEYQQALAEAEARLAVARAQLDQAQSDADTAGRTLSRVRSLNEKGIAATSELDTAQAEAANSNAALSVARAGITEARAQVETARVRLSYTRINADWPEADGERVVGQRMVEPGDTVAANTPLLHVVSITPLTAVIQVPEQLYTGLSTGQHARLRVAGATRAAFDATIERIAPIFDPETRRARVELSVPNTDGRLAPGMFVQIGLAAERLDDASVVPSSALVERDGKQGVFMVDAGDNTARFVAVEVAFTNQERAALRGPEALSGRVVVLGQAQLEDGIGVTVNGGADSDSAVPGGA